MKAAAGWASSRMCRDFAEAYLIASAEAAGIRDIVSFDRSIDRVTDRVTAANRIEP